MGLQEHQTAADSIVARCAVVTLSDTRTIDTDGSGRRIAELLEADGHVVAERRVIPDDPAQLISLCEMLLSQDEIDAVLTTGGTGISSRDQAVPAIENLIETPLPGFGELFRMLSFQQIGSAAMMSRALAGVAGGKLLFAMPGSTKAVELAMSQLIVPQIRHLLYELRK